MHVHVRQTLSLPFNYILQRLIPLGSSSKSPRIKFKRRADFRIPVNSDKDMKVPLKQPGHDFTFPLKLSVTFRAPASSNTFLFGFHQINTIFGRDRFRSSMTYSPRT